MARSRKERLPYRVTRGGFVAVSAAVLISLGLFWYGRESVEGVVMRGLIMEVPESMANEDRWWAIFAGSSFLGAALGTAIGQLFRDERGGAASMGAFAGALAGPAIVVFLIFAFVFVMFLRFGAV
jgi:hypothetical protein